MKVYVTLKAGKGATAEMFYDLTTIGDADFSVFISQLTEWKVFSLQSTLFTNQLVQKNSYN